MNRVFPALAATAVVLTGSPATGQQSTIPASSRLIQVAAGSESYGDWTVISVTDQVYMATTQNNAGSVFGTICSVEGCTALLNPKIQCVVGDSYPALVNSPGGAVSVELLCEDFGEGVLVYSFPIDDGVAEVMAVGGVLGMAFPMASGQFQVERFSLTGAARATARASQLAQGRTGTGRQNASDSSTL